MFDSVLFGRRPFLAKRNLWPWSTTIREVRSALARVLLEFGYEVETFNSAMTFFNCHRHAEQTASSST